jgi:uncharacterized protein (DUF433 family)
MWDRFETRPEVMFGKLCIKGTRVPVEAVVELVQAGWDDVRILTNYPTLVPEDLAAVHEFMADEGWEQSRVA